MKTISNVKRIFLSEDFNKLVNLLKLIKKDTHHQFLSWDTHGIAHGEDLQIIGHRIYTHPQNPTLNVLEIDYVNKVDTPTPTEAVESSPNVPTSSGDCK